MLDAIDLENIEKVQFSEHWKLSDVDLDLGSDQGHTSMHITYRRYQHTRPCDSSLKSRET